MTEGGSWSTRTRTTGHVRDVDERGSQRREGESLRERTGEKKGLEEITRLFRRQVISRSSVRGENCKPKGRSTRSRPDREKPRARSSVEVDDPRQRPAGRDQRAQRRRDT